MKSIYKINVDSSLLVGREGFFIVSGIAERLK
jgi:hypothetical protein